MIFESWSAMAAGAAAVSLSGLSKGGLVGVGMLATPVLALVLPPFEAAAVMLPVLVMQDAIGVVVYRRHVDWRTIRFMLPGTLCGIAAGYGLARSDSEVMTLMVVGLVSLWFGLTRLKRAAKRPKPGGAWTGGLWGALSGFTSMVANAGTPPFQIFVLPQRLPSERYAGTSVIFFALTNLIKIAPFLALGQLSPANLVKSASLAPIAFVSTAIGVLIVRRIAEQRYYGLVTAILVLVGAKLVCDGAVLLRL